MKVRKLQRLDEAGVWFDDAYAYEDKQGQTIFRYNLAWGRVGARHNRALRQQQTPLEQIETIIPPGEGLRWLPLETIPAEEVPAFLAHLNEACAIPQRGSVKQRQAVY